MSLNKFITDMLNISIDLVESIDSVDQSDNNVNIFIKLKRTLINCPICNNKLTINDYKRRKIKHSTLVNRKCHIIYKQRRCKCNECGKVFSEPNPFSCKSSNTSHETIINVLKDLKLSNETYTSVSNRFCLTVTQVQRIFDKHVDIPRKTFPEVLSIDEHYFPNSSYDSLYICILMDFKDGTIIDILPDRKKDYLIHYLSIIKNQTMDDKTKKSELDNVKYVSIDLYENYKHISQLYMPKAVVCADSFHVLEHLTNGFNKIRLRCRRTTEDENMIYLLTKFKHLFRHHQNLDNDAKYNKRFKKYLNYRQILNMMLDYFPDLKNGYYLKEKYITFNESSTIDEANDKLVKIIQEFGDSNLEEYIEFYNLLINWKQEIVNSFNMYNGKRINNSYIESRNKTIETILYNGNGYKNFKRTRNKLLYCLNKNDTYKL